MRSARRRPALRCVSRGPRCHAPSLRLPHQRPPLPSRLRISPARRACECGCAAPSRRCCHGVRLQACMQPEEKNEGAGRWSMRARAAPLARHRASLQHRPIPRLRIDCCDHGWVVSGIDNAQASRPPSHPLQRTSSAAVEGGRRRLSVSRIASAALTRTQAHSPPLSPTPHLDDGWDGPRQPIDA